jgi:murein DD-endopeptidase MepM/ murein hydrolase activator NlpD
LSHLSPVYLAAWLNERQNRHKRLCLSDRFSAETESNLRSVHFGVVRPTSLAKRLSFFATVGAEPPIDAKGDRAGAESHRRVSLRWLAGTGLTGLIGAGLLGGAIYAAFDREANFAEAPTRAAPARKETAEGVGVNPRKGDRIVKAVDIVAAKQTFKTPTAVRIGDHEVVRSRSFTRVSTTLALSETGLGADVPDFNPLKFLADSSNAQADAPDLAPDATPPLDDAEVSFTSGDLSPSEFVAESGALSLDEVRAQVAETVKNAQASGNRAPLPLPPQLLLMRTSHAALEVPGSGLSYASPGVSNTNSPFSSIEVRMVPENVTLAPRTTPPPAEAAHTSPATEQMVVVRHGEDIDGVLSSANVGKNVVAAVKGAFRGNRGGDPVSEGRRVKLSFSETETGDKLQLARLAVYEGDNLLAAVALADDGRYLLMERSPAAEKKVKRSPSDEESDDEDEDSGGMRLYNSLYETALKQDIPRPIIDQMVRTFGNDVDFQRGVAPGDSVDAFYDDGDDGEGGHAELLYASITARGETFKYYRFQSPDDQGVDFYDPSGRSTRKFLLRKPMATGEFRGGFGMRYHPILHYTRPHNGVDWAAPVGTPIFAAGNGVVVKSGFTSGYGRRVEIEHVNGYVTTYNHMSGFGRGIREGVRISQGQVVGYLGSSGLSTGPHLHYEVIVNGHYVDPMRVKLARTRQFDGKMLGDFKRERDRIDGLMAKAPNATRVAGP